MEMTNRWDRLIESLEVLVEWLKMFARRRVPAGDPVGEEGIEAVRDTCHDRLEAVLLPTEDHHRINRRVANAVTFHMDGQVNAAVYEATWGLRLANTLRTVNGC